MAVIEPAPDYLDITLVGKDACVGDELRILYSVSISLMRGGFSLSNVVETSSQSRVRAYRYISCAHEALAIRRVLTDVDDRLADYVDVLNRSPRSTSEICRLAILTNGEPGIVTCLGGYQSWCDPNTVFSQAEVILGAAGLAEANEALANFMLSRGCRYEDIYEALGGLHQRWKVQQLERALQK